MAIHALRRTPRRPGDSTIVLGAGSIGLLVQQCAVAAGAGASLHTATVGLDDLERAFQRLLSGDGSVKILVDPNA